MSCKIQRFCKRLSKIGIHVDLAGNYPWVYLEKVNGIRVKSKLYSDHGFTAFMIPVRTNHPIQVVDIKKLFEEIRKCLKK